MAENKTFEEKLQFVIHKLVAPKSQFNKFGNYNYRSCEDILEAVKPLLHSQGLRLKLSDKMVQIGSHNYVEATAFVTDGDKSDSATAYAREAEEQKGMQDSQITGSTSSYARKYALNGLFDIDDNKDADTNEQRDQISNSPDKEKYEIPGRYAIKIKGLLNTLEVYDETRDSILEQVVNDKKAEELIAVLEQRVAAKKQA